MRMEHRLDHSEDVMTLMKMNIELKRENTELKERIKEFEKAEKDIAEMRTNLKNEISPIREEMSKLIEEAREKAMTYNKLIKEIQVLKSELLSPELEEFLKFKEGE